MSDAVTLLREIASDTASMAASKVGPSEEQRSQIDKPAEDNVWHESPDFGKMKSQGKAAKQKGEESKPMVGHPRFSGGLADKLPLRSRKISRRLQEPALAQQLEGVTTFP